MILFSGNNTELLKERLKAENVYVVTDANVFSLYPELFANSKVFVIDPGEDSKTLQTVKKICADMLEYGCGRKTVLYAVGGGVVGDIAGFAAAVFMRGISWVSVPTTLLSQVDSGIGGKTGVNLDDYKNIIGAFHQPAEILSSVHFLKTLPEREVMCGVGEVIKTAFLCPPILEIIAKELSALLSLDELLLAKVIKMCASFKEEIVRQDEKETTGLRKVLNLGHTIGHALEKADKHALSHGEYVLWGLLLESHITKNYVNMQSYFNNQNILKKVLKGRTIAFDTQTVVDAARYDKKNLSDKVSIIALVECGITKEMFFSASELVQRLNEAKKDYNLN